MNEFMASNEATVRSSDTGLYVDGPVIGCRVYPEAVVALREFFQHEANYRPWHDAKEGEVWVLDLTNGQTHPAIFQADAFRDTGGSWTVNEITSARKIWPEQ